MKYLIDTNILIPLEPATVDGLSAESPMALQFIQIVLKSKHEVFLHPSQIRDIARDPDEARRAIREAAFNKYLSLPSIPETPDELTEHVGNPERYSNDWVDNQLVTALYVDAIHYLISNDQGIHRKARRLGLAERALTLSVALNTVEILFDRPTIPPPAVRSITAYEIDHSDHFFDGFRTDYPGFDDWLIRCKREHRQAWIIDGETTKYAAVCIVNNEKIETFGLKGRILKICTFKVNQEYSGFHYGELLLKTVFQYALRNGYCWLYITVHPKYDTLINLLQYFGFTSVNNPTDTGDIRFIKSLVDLSNEKDSSSPLEYFKKFGPYSFHIQDVQNYIVPILPKYHRLLFPDAELQIDLIKRITPYGNGILKAYLSGASIRQISPGSVLYFYRSDDLKGITTVGVVEEWKVSEDPEEIASFVGSRTVYSFEEITMFCSSPTIAILFQHAGILNRPIFYDDLLENKVVKGPPQSIQSVSEEGVQWLQNQIRERLPY